MGSPGLTGKLLFPSCERLRAQEGCIYSRGLVLVGIKGMVKTVQALSDFVKVKLFFLFASCTFTQIFFFLVCVCLTYIPKFANGILQIAKRLINKIQGIKNTFKIKPP